jgi:undecaprenyl-diphosphatase
MIHRYPHGRAREECPERPGAFEAQTGKGAFFDEPRPHFLPDVGSLAGRNGSRRSPDDGIVAPEQLRPGAALAARAAVDEIAIAHRPISTGAAASRHRHADGFRLFGARRSCEVGFAPVVPPADLEILRAVNQPAGAFVDWAMEAASERGLLLGIAGIAAVYAGFRSSHRWLAAVLIFAAIGVADLASVRAVKPLAARARPCQEFTDVRTPEGCGAGKSFPSTHAADSAAAATVFAWALPRLSALGIVIAAAVGFSRVYLGVHWPSDVAAGWALGIVVGLFLVSLSRLRYLFVRR